MTDQTKATLKKIAKRTGITLITAGLLVIAGNVVNTIVKDDYIGGPGTLKVAVPKNVTDPAVLEDKLNKPLSDAGRDLKMTQIKFRNDRIVQLFGEVNEDSAKAVIKQIGKLNKQSDSKPITLIISSPGGSVLDGALIVDAINGSKAPVNTLCTQMCASMAALIHQYGKNRYVLSHAVLMFHPAAGGAYGDVDRMASELAMIQRYVGSMEINAANRAKISIEQYKIRANAQIWLTGDESIKAGFADGVVYVTAQDVDKLFQPDPISQDTDKKNKTKKVKASFKNFIVQVLGSAIQFVNSSDDNSPIETIRRDFNDVPPGVAPKTSTPESDLKSVK
jgi:ATP-dependent Clp protease, protease subunit